MKNESSQVFLMLGGNLGNTHQIFLSALELLSKSVGTVVLKSSLYQSDPWGMEDQPVFLNQAILINTTLEPLPLLSVLNKIENQLGRTRDFPNSPRTIDIDILLMGSNIIDSPNLQVPHPRLHLRRFNLIPLAEIASDVIHPVFRNRIAEMVELCNDPLKVTKINS